ncbi:hypothetical protein ET989_13780 [Propioniciclava sinopodophylli]|uniref:Uncharacterized protein n=1 Tax=Propioniciclava sinopodophylli TaxID=1837344 RepID=A0A4Q9KCP5_9ACTN|nr:hypothetical protein [Propioniciclava sinopodophylli]TBT82654.1 hypothetical protein ET989_13780 [Propioniciclava sinopodophylli]
MDAAPEALHDDRLALAGALAFGAFMAGQMVVDGRRVSIGVATALTAALAPFVSGVEPVFLPQRRFPAGHGTLAVGTDPGGLQELMSEASAQVGLEVCPGDQATGRMLVGRTMRLASNATALRNLAATINGARVYPEAAVAVLFAEDLGCDHLVIRADAALDAMRPAFIAAGLRLDVLPPISSGR